LHNGPAVGTIHFKAIGEQDANALMSTDIETESDGPRSPQTIL